MRKNRGILTVVAFAMLLMSVRGAVSAEHAPAMSAEQALKLLLEGNQRFIAGKMEHPNQTQPAASKSPRDSIRSQRCSRAPIREPGPKSFSTAASATSSWSVSRATLQTRS